ncbi:hypothetical protein PV342_28625 [Streptomyces sp. PA03-3a]|nr:hypothetical protein [Streptomyces sp. PA03-3a]
MSGCFEELWQSRVVGFHSSDRKTVHHPHLGPVTVTWATLTVPGRDLGIAVYSAPPGSRTAQQFEMLAAIGSRTCAHRKPVERRCLAVGEVTSLMVGDWWHIEAPGSQGDWGRSPWTSGASSRATRPVPPTVAVGEW